VGRDHGAHYHPARGANCDANKGANPARIEIEPTRFRARRAGGRANARPDGSADYQANQGMLPRLGAEDVETRTTSPRFIETPELFSCNDSSSSLTVTNAPAWRFMLDSITSIPWPAFRRFKSDHEPSCF
jgi:hypothetical protein